MTRRFPTPHGRPPSRETIIEGLRLQRAIRQRLADQLAAQQEEEVCSWCNGTGWRASGIGRIPCRCNPDGLAEAVAGPPAEVVGIAGWQPPGLQDRLRELGLKPAKVEAWELTWTVPGGGRETMTFPVPIAEAEAEATGGLLLAVAVWTAQWAAEGVDLIRAERVAPGEPKQ